MPYLRATLPILGVIGIIACNEQTQRAPATADSPMTPNANASGGEMQPASGARTAAEQIAEARCHREKTCGNIGPGRDYASLEDCTAFVRADWRADLDRLVCPGGVNRDQLNECLTQINGASCSSPFDKLERVAACTQGQICVDES